jgi:hypothetical protein
MNKINFSDPFVMCLLCFLIFTGSIVIMSIDDNKLNRSEGMHRCVIEMGTANTKLCREIYK